MDVANIFLSIGASDHGASCAWWSGVLDRGPDRRPMPGCCEWDLADSVLFQVLDNPESGAVGIVSLRVADLDREIARLREEGIAIDDAEPVPGFETLRITQFHDPDGNEVNLLGGE